MKLKERIQREIKEQQLATKGGITGIVEPRLNLDLDKANESLGGISQAERLNVQSSIISMETALSKLRVQNSLDAQREMLKELEISQKQNLFNTSQLETEIKITELKERRARGVQLEAEEMRRLLEMEVELESNAYSQKRMMAAKQNELSLKAQVSASEFAAKQAAELAETEEDRNKILELSKAYTEELEASSERQLQTTLNQIDAEERLNRARSEAARNSRINESGLFGDASSLNKFYKRGAIAALDNPAYANLFKQAGEQVSLDRGASARGFSFDQEVARLMGLGHEEGQSPELDALLRAKYLADTYARGQLSIALEIGENNKNLFNQLNEIKDRDATSATVLNRSGSADGGALYTYLESQRNAKMAELDLQLENKIANAMLLKGLKEGTDEYQAERNRIITENIKDRRKEEAQIERTFTEGLRKPFGGLSNETFDINKIASSDMANIMQSNVLKDLGEMRNIERQIDEEYRGVSLESRARIATGRHKQELQNVQKALEEGNLEEAESAQRLAEEYGNVAIRIQELSEAYLKYNQRRYESLKITMTTERETAFNEMQNTEREIGLQLELAELKKKTSMTDSQLAEVAHERRRQFLEAEFINERELFELRYESQNLALAQKYDSTSDEFKEGKKELDLRMYQEGKILDIQQQQKLTTLESTEKLRKLNEEQTKGIKSFEQGMSSILGAYFSFIGSIFTNIFEAIFGKKKDRKKEEAELSQERIKKLEKQKNDLAKEVSLRISTESNTVTGELVDVNRELIETNRELISALREDKKIIADAYRDPSRGRDLVTKKKFSRESTRTPYASYYLDAFFQGAPYPENLISPTEPVLKKTPLSIGSLDSYSRASFPSVAPSRHRGEYRWLDFSNEILSKSSSAFNKLQHKPIPFKRKLDVDLQGTVANPYIAGYMAAPTPLGSDVDVQSAYGDSGSSGAGGSNSGAFGGLGEKLDKIVSNTGALPGAIVEGSNTVLGGLNKVTEAVGSVASDVIEGVDNAFSTAVTNLENDRRQREEATAKETNEKLGKLVNLEEEAESSGGMRREIKGKGNILWYGVPQGSVYTKKPFEEDPTAINSAVAAAEAAGKALGKAAGASVGDYDQGSGQFKGTSSEDSSAATIRDAARRQRILNTSRIEDLDAQHIGEFSKSNPGIGNGQGIRDAHKIGKADRIGYGYMPGVSSFMPDEFIKNKIPVTSPSGGAKDSLVTSRGNLLVGITGNSIISGEEFETDYTQNLLKQGLQAHLL